MDEMILKLFISSFLFSVMLHLSVIFLAKKYQLFIDSEMDKKPQKMHTLPTPRAGGIGIFTPFFWGLVLFYLYHPQPLLLGLFVGGSIIFMSGIIEDFNASLNPKTRLILQCLGAGFFVFLSESYLSNLGFGIELPAHIGIPFSIFAIVGMVNALNIIDGFNGLASGITLLALVCLYFLLPHSLIESCLIIILIASVLGFFIFNFPWGKIFLGDGGAYFLGFVLAGLLIHITQTPLNGETTPNISPWFGIALLIYPFWEVIFSIYRRRFIRHLSPVQPDKLHLHTILYKRFLKHNAKTSLFIVLSVSPFMILSTFVSSNDLFLLLISLAFILIYGVIYSRSTLFARKKR